MASQKSVSQNYLSLESQVIREKWERKLANGDDRNSRNRSRQRAIEWALWKAGSLGCYVPDGSYGRLDEGGVVIIRHESEWVDENIVLPAHCQPVKDAMEWHKAAQSMANACGLLQAA